MVAGLMLGLQQQQSFQSMQQHSSEMYSSGYLSMLTDFDQSDCKSYSSAPYKASSVLKDSQIVTTLILIYNKEKLQILKHALASAAAWLTAGW